MNFSGEDFIFAGAVALLVAAASLVKRLGPPPRLLKQWAKEHGYEILSVSYRSGTHGPFKADAFTEAQHVYRITIRGSDGQRRDAWVRFNQPHAAEPLEAVWDAMHPPHGN